MIPTPTQIRILHYLAEQGPTPMILYMIRWLLWSMIFLPVWMIMLPLGWVISFVAGEEKDFLSIWWEVVTETFPPNT